MFNKYNLIIKHSKNQRISIIFLIIILFLIQSYSFYIKYYNPTDIEYSAISYEIDSLYKEYNKNIDNQTYTFNKKEYKKYLKRFDPNDFTQQDWRKIGFSEKQALVILKYKNILGGSFTSKEQIKKCFVISDEKFKELEPLLFFNNNNFKSIKEQEYKKYLKKFDPNDFTQENWQKIGFSEKQALVILKYKNVLGGSFTSKEQIKKCFVISEEKFKELEPFLVINNNKVEQKIYKKDLNQANFYDFNNYEIPSEIKAKIIAFRKALGGFYKKEQLLEVYGIDKNIASQIMSDFDLDKNQIIKININSCPEEDLKKQVYIRKYAYKILELRKNNKINPENLKEILNDSSDYDRIISYILF